MKSHLNYKLSLVTVSAFFGLFSTRRRLLDVQNKVSNVGNNNNNLSVVYGIVDKLTRSTKQQ